MSRKLVTVRTVDAIEPIANADAIEVAVFGGWRSVVKCGEFAVGDLAVYVEVDSALPLNDSRFAFLAPRGVKEIDGESFHVLRTTKLRGAQSQGLVLPLHAVPEAMRADDIAEVLGVKLYEPPIPVDLAGTVRGTFPTDIVRKTDAERVQDLSLDLPRFRGRGLVCDRAARRLVHDVHRRTRRVARVYPQLRIGAYAAPHCREGRRAGRFMRRDSRGPGGAG